VGLGVPRQELWIAQHRYLCPQAIWIGVGGSFDIWSGTKNRAPAWLGKNNLEWLYRLYQEPWRWRRMLALPEFALKAFVYHFTARGAIS
jgi:N-acetylglucosaminyldiphosphoundecaprenol N-acetyl-beta-D-mannosaminyltransferase